MAGNRKVNTHYPTKFDKNIYKITFCYLFFVVNLITYCLMDNGVLEKISNYLLPFICVHFFCTG